MSGAIFTAGVWLLYFLVFYFNVQENTRVDAFLLAYRYERKARSAVCPFDAIYLSPPPHPKPRPPTNVTSSSVSLWTPNSLSWTAVRELGSA